MSGRGASRTVEERESKDVEQGGIQKYSSQTGGVTVKINCPAGGGGERQSTSNRVCGENSCRVGGVKK